MSDPLLGQVIADRYHLVKVVGRGGMGVVYRAEDTRLGGRPCAVKLLLGTSMDPEEAERFEREVRIISRLRSQHVVQVLDTGILADGRRFIVMELLEGLPLSTMLKRMGSLPPDRAVTLIRGVLAGLAEAHETGVVHRDLKPANVFVCQTRTGDEVVKVLDFGIAKDTRSATARDLTAASILIGTPKYMAPEQFLKEPADERTDLYAAGLLFYQMLAGAPPFTDESPVPESVVRMPGEFRVGWLHINQPPAPLQLPEGLWPILDCMLAKEREHRFQSADDALHTLAPFSVRGTIAPGQLTAADIAMASGEVSHPGESSSTTGFPVMGETLSQPIAAPRPRRLGWVVALLLLLGAGGAGAWFVLQAPGAPPSEERHALGAGVCVDEIRTVPPGAVVKMGGRALGVTPYETKRPCSEKWLVVLEAKGYQDRRIELKSRNPRDSTFVPLVREQAPPPLAPRRAAPTPAPTPKPKAAPPAPTKRRWKPRPQPARPAPAPKPRAPAGDSPLPF